MVSPPIISRAATEASPRSLRPGDRQRTGAEPLYAVALHDNGVSQHTLTFLFARRGVDLPLPVADTLFVDEDVYTWKLADLVRTAGFWIGEHAVGEAADRKAAAERTDDARLARNVACYGLPKRRLHPSFCGLTP
jgi:hypothetical protein